MLSVVVANVTVAMSGLFYKNQEQGRPPVECSTVHDTTSASLHPKPVSPLCSLILLYAL